MLAEFVPDRCPRLTWTAFGSAVLAGRFEDTIRPALDDAARVGLVADPDRRQGAGYYLGAALGLRVLDDEGAVVDVGAGGVTDWTASLRGDAKERCVISCVATERPDAQRHR